MAINDLAPGFAKIYYSVDGRYHIMTLPTTAPALATVGEEPSLPTKSGGSMPFTDFVEDFTAVLVPLLPDVGVIYQAEWYRKQGVEYDPIWIFTAPVGAPGAGTGGSVVNLDGQLVGSFRTTEGGLARIYIMEPSANNNMLWNPPLYTGFTAIADLAAYMTGDDSPITGRDNGFLVSPMRFASKTNDVLRKKNLLNG